MITLDDIAPRLNGAKHGHRYGKPVLYALCPYHDERKHSMVVGPDYGYYCFACGASGNFKQLAIDLGVMPPEHEYFRRHPVNNGGHHTIKSLEWGRIVATYTYVDKRGIPLYDVVRFVPKDFRIRRHVYDGGQYLGRQWGIGDKRRVLYRLPEIIKRKDDVVWFVEGEKDADRLYRLGLLATTCAGGVGEWANTDTGCLRGRDVAIIPDNDKPGLDGAGVLAGRLRGCAGRVHIVRLEGLVEKQDVSDWLDAGHTVEELCTLL